MQGITKFSLVTALTLLLTLSNWAQAESRWARFHIPGMTCQGCTLQIRRELKKIPGVQQVHVNRGKEEVKVIYDDAKAQIPDMEAAIAIAGFAGRLSSTSD